MHDVDVHRQGIGNPMLLWPRDALRYPFNLYNARIFLQSDVLTLVKYDRFSSASNLLECRRTFAVRYQAFFAITPSMPSGESSVTTSKRKSE